MEVLACNNAKATFISDHETKQ